MAGKRRRDVGVKIKMIMNIRITYSLFGNSHAAPDNAAKYFSENGIILSSA
jgi:hypothetical protein